MSKLNIVDSTVRDGVQSLWAIRLKLSELLPITPYMDQAGYKVIDLTGAGHWSYFGRFLREDPWERIRRVRENIVNTPLQMWMRSRGIYDFGSVPKPQPVAKLWLDEFSNVGIGRIIFLEEENDFSNIVDLIPHAQSKGMSVIVPIMYSMSPYHTYEYHRDKAKELVKLGANAIEIKDQGGLLTPETTKWFVNAIQEGAEGKVDLEFQTHCTTGMGLVSTLEAIKEGVTTIRSCLPPLCEGSSLPNTFSVIDNARYLGYENDLDRSALEKISEHLTSVAKRENLPIGVPVEYDAFQFEHQVPGGVKGTLRWQLKQLGREDCFEEVLRETARVRRDLGYPIMVTPGSQYIVAQATMNVLGGERYKVISDEVIAKVALPEAVPSPGPIDPALKEKVLANRRTEEVISNFQKPSSLEELRAKMGSRKESNQDFLSRMAIPEADYQEMKRNKLDSGYLERSQPHMLLLRNLLDTRKGFVHISKGDFEVTLQ